MRNLLIFILVALIATSCVTVQFTEPQPAGEASLSTFPESFLGTYIITEYRDSEKSEADTLVIFPEGFLAISRESRELTLEEAASDPDIRIQDSLLYRLDINPQAGYPYVRTDSSIRYSYWEREKSFLSDSVILKNYKGEYYLNMRDEPSRYNVLLLKQERNGDLAVWMVDPEKEIEHLQEYTRGVREEYNSEGKVEKYIVSPKAKELNKFVQNGGFKYLLYRLYRAE
ncbi:MAG: hypothetical protein R3D00_17550 [Bacteroidia bacterium]